MVNMATSPTNSRGAWPGFRTALVLFALLVPWSSPGQTTNRPTDAAVVYQGRLRVANQPFHGLGQFKFSILDDQGAAALSTGAVSLSVSNGFYTVRLGGASPDMPGFDEALLRTNRTPKLRIWFHGEDGAWRQAGEDVPLPTVGQSAPAPADTQTAILSELKQIRALLAQQAQYPQRPAPPPPAEPQIVTVSVAHAPSLGSTNAPLALVEFTDFECPYCSKFQTESFPKLMKEYVDTGKLRVFSRNLTMSFHAQAEPAAKAAIQASRQGKFWPMRDNLFAARGALSLEAITRAAREAGVDPGSIPSSQTNAEVAAELRQDLQDARAAGLRATPSFVIGTLADGKVTGLQIVGAQPYAVFEAEIQKRLAARK